MKTIMITAVSLACLATLPTIAYAGQKVDMAELTCKEFMADPDGIMPTIFWIDGYLSNASGNTVIDPDQMGQNVQDVAKECNGNPDQKILDLFN
ncbi:HdeA/HdeB family chaperone [Pleomorphomonas sp. NRK KF1]|uniref:HdeA/HdeB family chaperone n=1 Tax=Pleomorphomonas sp. NRK KF1 TaxID=2943000 RepID=UPI002043503F|nr:HdeA/HdeB family chaperone [Pleomorphomonas sp. NRK KF1]MCM5553376.1 HdeA family protein [Pleomorphomonas sp. NRK KF1]